jgi:hypothetical protein
MDSSSADSSDDSSGDSDDFDPPAEASSCFRKFSSVLRHAPTKQDKRDAIQSEQGLCDTEMQA